MRTQILLFLIFAGYCCSAQINLVPNPGFETYTSCPTGSGQWQKCSSWNNVNMNQGAGAWGTPDYFTNCGTNQTSPPATFAGTCSPHGGTGMMALVVYNNPFPQYREYMAVPLTCSMTPGNTYTVSFWITNGSGIKSPWTIKNLGITFSSGPLSQTGWGLINATPQWEITTNVATNTWAQYSFTINPTAPWNNMTIGAFRPDSSNNAIMSYSNPGGPNSAYANYFFDDFSVLAPAVNGSITLTAFVTQPTVCNGPGAVVIVPSQSATISYTWNPSNFSGTSLNPAPPGAYTVSGSYLSSSCLVATTSVQFTINSTPPPQVSITATTYTVCGTDNVTLTANASGGTPPLIYNWGLGPSSPIYIVNQQTPGPVIYSVFVTDAVGCTASDTILIDHREQPIVQTTQSAICTGGTATLTANGANSYTWNPGNVVGQQLIVSPTATTIYTVVGTSTSGCMNTAFASQVVFITPTVTASSTKTLACPGETLILTGSGASSYTWDSTPSGSNYFTTATAPLTHTVIGSTNICFDTAYISITLKPIPTLAFNSHSINCASLGSATAIISGGTGPFTHTWNPTLQTGTIASNLFPGNYTFTVFDQGTQCQITPTIYFAPLVPLAGTVVSTPSLVCPAAINGSANIILTGGSGSQTYAWTDKNGIQTVSNPTTLAAGINSVLVTDLLTFCTVTHTFFINGPPSFSLQLSSSSNSVCLGDSIFVGALLSGGTPGYTYTWISKPSGNTFYAKETAAGNFSYVVQTNDANNCGYGDTIVLKFVPNPTVTVSSTSVCPLIAPTLTASGASTYSWSVGITTNTFSQVHPATAQYTVTGWHLGCQAKATATVFVFPSPSPTITSNSPVCQNDSLWFSGSGAASYQWSGPHNFLSSSVTTLIALATPSASGIYTLKATSVEGCTAQISKSFTVHPTPLLVAGGSTVCEGSALNMNSNFLANATYSWTGPGFTSSLQNPVINAAQLTQTGTYSVLLQSVLGCTALTTVHASVVAKPVIALAGDSAACEKAAFNLSVSGGSSYAWHGPGGYYNTSAQLMIPSASLAHGGIYTVSAIYGPCTSQRSISLTVNPLPPVNLAPAFTVCEMSGLQLNHNSNTATTYTWNGPGGYSSNVQSPFISPVLLAGAGVYSLIISDVFGCSNTATTKLIVLNAPSLSVKDQSVCLGGAITLTVSGGTNYTWQGPAGFAATGGSVVLSVVNFSNSGIYIVSSTGTNNCTASANINLTTYSVTLPLPSVRGSTILCAGNNLSLTAGGGIVYQWTTPEGKIFPGDTLSIKNVQLLTAGVYTLTVKNESLCAVSRSVNVIVHPLPQGYVVTNRNYQCAPYCATISPAFHNSEAIQSFNFKVGDKITKDTAMAVCLNKPGEYITSLSMIDTNQCMSTSTLTLVAFEKPVANFNFHPSSPRAGIDEVAFTNLSSGYYNASWAWYFLQSDSVNSQEENPNYIFNQPGMHALVLVVKNQSGCSDTLVKTIIVEDEFLFYVPNTFTPDGDGLNDVFIPKGQGIKTYRFEIFNRWGQEVFFTRDFTTGWDGTYKGVPCKDDTYVWRITLTDASSKNREYNGHVNLLSR